MSELQVIESALDRASRRRRLQRALLGLSYGALAGTVVLLLAVGALKLFPVPERIVGVAGALAAIFALTGFVLGRWRQPNRLEMARWIDERKQFKERISTALEFSAGASAKDWRQLLVHDAASHAASL